MLRRRLRSAGDSEQTQLTQSAVPVKHAYPIPPCYYITVFDSRQKEPRNKKPLDEAFDADKRLCWEQHNAYFYSHWWMFAPDTDERDVFACYHLISRYAQLQDNLLSGGAALIIKGALDAGLDVGADCFTQSAEGNEDIFSGRWATRKLFFLGGTRVNRPAIDVEDTIVDEWCGFS